MIAISVENISKRYLIRHESAPAERYITFRENVTFVVNNLAQKTRNVLFGRAKIEGKEVEEFWALKDVSFDVKFGEKLGIIGRNGAGKSTLLKILSRITEPTCGKITIRGRVASLLEVGTGFHPELSGRENIYLNGAILGMSQAEIKRKFDDIVAFAEVENFLDTPVKRYSSGMYVRLAFAVAAHLEPEILIVDEVLAVGDAQFQKKCLGRMNDVAKEGRTVLFVSHNMAAIRELCPQTLLMANGMRLSKGASQEVIQQYLDYGDSLSEVDLRGIERASQYRQNYARLTRLRLMNEDGVKTTTFVMNESLVALIQFECVKEQAGVEIGLKISSRYGSAIHYLTSSWEGLKLDLKPGVYEVEMRLPKLLVFPGTYAVGLWILSEPDWSDDALQEVTFFSVLKAEIDGKPNRVEQYAVSGCETYAASFWRVINKEV